MLTALSLVANTQVTIEKEVECTCPLTTGHYRSVGSSSRRETILPICDTCLRCEEPYDGVWYIPVGAKIAKLNLELHEHCEDRIFKVAIPTEFGNITEFDTESETKYKHIRRD